MSAFYAINFPSAGRKRNTRVQTPPLLLFANNLSFLLASAKTKLELQQAQATSNKKNSAKKLNFKIMWSTEIRTVVFLCTLFLNTCKYSKTKAEARKMFLLYMI